MINGYSLIQQSGVSGKSQLQDAFDKMIGSVTVSGGIPSGDFLTLQSALTTETNNRTSQDNILNGKITQNKNDITLLNARSLQSTFDTNPSDLSLIDSGKIIYVDEDYVATDNQVIPKKQIEYYIGEEAKTRLNNDTTLSNRILSLEQQSLQTQFNANPSDLYIGEKNGFHYKIQVGDVPENETDTSRVPNIKYVDDWATTITSQINNESLDDIQFRTPLKADLDLTYSNFKTILGTVDVKTQINMINDAKIILRDLETGTQIQDQEPVPWHLVNQITTGLDNDIQSEITRAQNSETNLQNQLNNKMEANISLSSINRPNASLNLDNQKIINLAPATLSADAVNKQQLDSVQTTLQTNIDGKLSNSTTIHDLPVTNTFGLGSHDLTMDGTLYTTNLDATLVNCDNLICANARSSNNVGDIFATENKVTQDINTESTRIQGLINNLDNNLQTQIDGKLATTTKLNQIVIPNDQVNMNNNRIINLFDPNSAQDAATKNYVDSSISNAISGGTTTNQTLQQIQTQNPGNLDMLSTNRLILRSNMNNESIQNLPLDNEAVSYKFTFDRITQFEASLETEQNSRVSGDQALDARISDLQNQLNYVPVDPELTAVTKMIATQNYIQANDDLNMNSNKIYGLQNAVNSDEAINKGQLDDALSNKMNANSSLNSIQTAVPIDSNLNLGNYTVQTSKTTGFASDELVPKSYVDANAGGTSNQTLQQIQDNNPITANLNLGSYGVSTTQSQFGNNDLVSKAYVNSIIPQSSAFEYLSLFSVNVFPALNGYFGNSNWNIRRQQTNTLISYDTNTGMFTLQPGTYTMGVGYASNNVQTCNVTAFNDVTGNRLCQDILGITATSVVYDVWYSEVKYYSAGGWQFKNSPITFTINTAVRVKFQLTNQTFTNNVLYYVNVQTAMPNAVSFSTASNDINMNNFYLNNLPNPVLNQQPVTLAYFNANLAAASSTFNSNINMQNLYKVTNLANGSLSSDSCTYGQLTSAISGLSSTYMPLTYRLDQITVPTASLNLNNQRITNLGNPQANGDAVNVLHLNTNFYPITGSVQRIRLNANTGSLIAQFPTSTTYTISRQSQTGNYMILSSADHSLEQSHDSITRYGFTSGATLKKLTDTAEYQTRPLWLSSSTSVSRDARLYVSRPTGATQSRLVVFEDAGVGGSFNDAGLYANCFCEFNRNVQINGNFQAVSYSILGTWLGGQPSQAKLLVANNNSTDTLSIETEGHIYSNGNVYADNFVTIVPVSMREYKKEIMPVYNEDLRNVEMIFFKYDHQKLEQDGFPGMDRLPDENQIQTGFCLDNVPGRYWRHINQKFSTIENINQLKDDLLGFLMQENRQLYSKCQDFEQRLRYIETYLFSKLE